MKSIETLSKIENFLNWLHDKAKGLQVWFLEKILAIFMAEMKLREKAVAVLTLQTLRIQDELDELKEATEIYKKRIDNLK